MLRRTSHATLFLTSMLVVSIPTSRSQDSELQPWVERFIQREYVDQVDSTPRGVKIFRRIATALRDTGLRDDQNEWFSRLQWFSGGSLGQMGKSLRSSHHRADIHFRAGA